MKKFFLWILALMTDFRHHSSGTTGPTYPFRGEIQTGDKFTNTNCSDLMRPPMEFDHTSRYGSWGFSRNLSTRATKTADEITTTAFEKSLLKREVQSGSLLCCSACSRKNGILR